MNKYIIDVNKMQKANDNILTKLDKSNIDKMYDKLDRCLREWQEGIGKRVDGLSVKVYNCNSIPCFLT